MIILNPRDVVFFSSTNTDKKLDTELFSPVIQTVNNEDALGA